MSRRRRAGFPLGAIIQGHVPHLTQRRAALTVDAIRGPDNDDNNNNINNYENYDDEA